MDVLYSCDKSKNTEWDGISRYQSDPFILHTSYKEWSLTLHCTNSIAISVSNFCVLSCREKSVHEILYHFVTYGLSLHAGVMLQTDYHVKFINKYKWRQVTSNGHMSFLQVNLLDLKCTHCRFLDVIWADPHRGFPFSNVGLHIQQKSNQS